MKPTTRTNGVPAWTNGASNRQAGPTVPDRWLSSTEVSEMAGVSTDTVRSWVKRGKLNGFKIGRRFRFLEKDVKNLLRRRGSGATIVGSRKDCGVPMGGLMTPDDLAIVLGVDLGLVENWMKTGCLPFVVVNGMALLQPNVVVRVFGDSGGVNGVHLSSATRTCKLLKITAEELAQMTMDDQIPHVNASNGSKWYGTCVIMGLRNLPAAGSNATGNATKTMPSGNAASNRSHGSSKTLSSSGASTVVETRIKLKNTGDPILDAMEETLGMRRPSGRKIHEVITEPSFSLMQVAKMFGVTTGDVLAQERDGKIDWILGPSKDKVYPLSEVRRLEDVYGEPMLWRACLWFEDSTKILGV